MSITIKLPETTKGGDCILGLGTKVFTDKGEEVEGITSINVNIETGSIVTATVNVSLTAAEDMKNIHALLGTDTLEQVAEMHGMKLVKI